MSDPENSADDAMQEARATWWSKVQLTHDQLRRVDLALAEAAFADGWDAAMAAVKAERLHTEKIVSEERAEEARWNRGAATQSPFFDRVAGAGR